jgi:hypothetical protein
MIKIILIIIILILLYLIYNNNINIENFKSNNKNLVFTSAGDNTNSLIKWISQNQYKNFDLYTVYYGNSIEDKYKSISNYWLRRKGTKFQNFYYVWKNNRKIINNYNKIFILDDDIIMDTKTINKCFKLSYKYNLWLCQPSYNPKSKISFKYQTQNKKYILRYTNFCEMGALLFDKNIINDVMNIYKPTVPGWGIDLIISDILTKKKKYNYRKIALLDIVSCINPHDYQKKDKNREIDKHISTKMRIKYFNDFAKKYNITFRQKNIKFYSNIKK